MKRIVFFAVLGLLMACQKDVPVTAILLNKTDIILKEGENETLTVSFTPSDATNQSITWLSSDPRIATVKDGIVTGVTPGHTEIVARCGSLTAQCDVTVVVAVA